MRLLQGFLGLIGGLLVGALGAVTYPGPLDMPVLGLLVCDRFGDGGRLVSLGVGQAHGVDRLRDWDHGRDLLAPDRSAGHGHGALRLHLGIGRVADSGPAVRPSAGLHGPYPAQLPLYVTNSRRRTLPAKATIMGDSTDGRQTRERR